MSPMDLIDKAEKDPEAVRRAKAYAPTSLDLYRAFLFGWAGGDLKVPTTHWQRSAAQAGLTAKLGFTVPANHADLVKNESVFTAQ